MLCGMTPVSLKEAWGHEMADGHMIDKSTERAVETFLGPAGAMFPISAARLFGSRACGDYCSYSDADLTILLKGQAGDYGMVTYTLGTLGFDVQMETGVEIQPIPIWEDEWAHPETFSNPSFLRNIAREGVRV